jgi:hypothetical protein
MKAKKAMRGDGSGNEPSNTARDITKWQTECKWMMIWYGGWKTERNMDRTKPLGGNSITAPWQLSCNTNNRAKTME